MFFRHRYSYSNSDSRGPRWHSLASRKKVGGRLMLISDCGESMRDDGRTALESNNVPLEKLCGKCAVALMANDEL